MPNLDAYGLICAGDVFAERFFDDGTSTGLLFIGFFDSFKITENAEMKKMKSKGRTTYGNVARQIPLKGESTLAVSGKDLRATNRAMALLGTVEPFSQEVGSDVVKTFDLSAITKDTYLDLGKYLVKTGSVSAVVGSTPYVLGEDYEVMLHSGKILVRSDGDIPDTGSLVVTFDHDAIAATDATITKGGTQSRIKVRWHFDGKNLDNGNHIIIDIPESDMLPTDGVDFLTDDFSTFALEGAINVVAGQSQPYSFVEFPPA
ncbi:MAG: hypothetical protein RDU30_09925 [Desulfovibrionaceae bacterium]|nr:hypothetical protein [Desulfovibrionaceae bacterium]